jgi:hypothetical protein
MAKVLNFPQRAATSGERRFVERLQTLLEEDYLCWFDVPVGPKRLRAGLHHLQALAA